MNKDGGFWSVLFWLALLGGGGYWFYTNIEDSGGMSGRRFYEACLEYKSKTVSFTRPTPNDPYQAGQWKNCELVVRRSMFAEGLLLAGNETDDDAQRLRRVCPDAWSEIPLAGAFYLYVQDTESEGGISILGSFLPAIWAVQSWAKKRWPNCSAERERQGYPRIIEKAPGVFDWEKACPKCK